MTAKPKHFFLLEQLIKTKIAQVNNSLLSIENNAKDVHGYYNDYL